VTNGFGEGRSATAFDPLSYIAGYDDLIGALGTNTQAATQHFIQYGFAEHRSRAAFDPLQYIASYGDLIQAFGTDTQAGAEHFIEHGFGEHRIRDKFNSAQYLANYADLRAAFGTDEQFATIHYIQHGYGEGRTDQPLSGHAPLKPEDGASPLVLVGDPDTGLAKANDGSPQVLLATSEGGLANLRDHSPETLPLALEPLINLDGWRGHALDLYGADEDFGVAIWAKAEDGPAQILPAEVVESWHASISDPGPAVALSDHALPENGLTIFGAGAHDSLTDLLRSGQTVHPDWAVLGG
jgi:hypothetical protein